MTFVTAIPVGPEGIASALLLVLGAFWYGACRLAKRRPARAGLDVPGEATSDASADSPSLCVAPSASAMQGDRVAPAAPRFEAYSGAHLALEEAPSQSIEARAGLHDPQDGALALLRQVLSPLPTAILIADSSRRIVFANAAAESRFGNPTGTLAGTSADALCPDMVRLALQAQRQACQAPLAGAGGQCRIADPSHPGRRAQGTQESAVAYSVHALPAGRHRWYLVYFQDAAQDRQREEDRETLLHLARVSSLGELAGSLAHELNQPLTAIVSNTQAASRYLRTTPPDLQELREILIDVAKDACRASATVRRIRALIRREPTCYAPIDLREAMEEAMAIMGTKAMTQGIRLVCQIDEGIPAVTGDRVQVQQVLLNLLLNAIDATSAVGRVNAPAARLPNDRRVVVHASEHAGMAWIAVRDWGCGIPEAGLASVFEPFMTSKPNGLGLGLSICRTIVAQHGGTLEARRNADAGVTFAFSLPCAAQEMGQPSPAAPAHGEGVG